MDGGLPALCRGRNADAAVRRDLEAYGASAFFAARGEETIDLKERALARVQRGGQPRARTAFFAVDLANEHAQHGRTPIASALARRTEHLLEGEPESYAHGFLALIRSEMAPRRGELIVRGVSAPVRVADVTWR